MSWALVLVLAALQQSAPTVGDTVWISTRVPLGARQILRPQSWDLGEVGQVLGPPTVEYSADSAVISYPVTFWYPGAHDVVVPGPIVVNPEGRSDTLPGRPVRIALLSVLPAGARPDTTPPKPPARPVEQSERSLFPLWLLLALTALGAFLWHRFGATALTARRRRKAALLVPEVVPPDPELAPILERWMAAGEIRAALEGWAALIHAAERERPSPDGSSEPLLDAIAAIGYRPDPPMVEVERVIRAARTWLAARAP